MVFSRRDSYLKNFMVRFGLLAVAGVVGFIAIAQAQRSSSETTEDAAALATNDGTSPSAAAPESLPAATSDASVFAPSGAPPAPAATSRPATEVLPVSSDFGGGNPLRGSLAPAAADQPDTARAVPQAEPATGRRDPFGLSAGAAATPPLAATEAPAAAPIAADSRYSDTSAAAGDRYAPRAGTPPAELATQPPSRDAFPDYRTPEPLAEASAPAPTAGPAAAPFPRRAEPDPIENRPPRSARLSDSGGLTSGRNDSLATPHERPVSPAPAAAFPARRPSGPAAETPQLGDGRPGTKQLEGPQTPALELTKSAPEEIQVGKPAKFKIDVRNTGQVTAHHVEVHDHIPSGARLIGTKPQASADDRGGVVWSVGTLEPGEERTLEMQLLPEREGEIGSVGFVTFRAEASVRTVATKPQLQIELSGPRQVMIGDEIKLLVGVTNTGTGVANNVLLFDGLPDQLRHAAGAEVEYDLGDLQPKELREVELLLTAESPGRFTNIVTARGEGELNTEASIDMEVIAPALQVSLEGPKRRYLEREATYVLSVANPGTAPAHEVELVSHLPKGMEFVSANNAGHYDSNSHAVYWSLAELPEGEVGSVKMTALPVESGQHTITVEGKAEQNLADRMEEIIRVEGVAALFFEVVDVEDPVEVGGETVYEIRVLNQGTKTATSIQLAVVAPPQLRPISAEGPTRHALEGGRVLFEPLARLAPKADTTYRVRVQGLQPGDQRLKVQVQSDEMDTPVTKEESTRVYADN